MKKARVKLIGVSPLSFSRHYVVEKLTSKESPRDVEERTWRERLHYDEHGECFIPPMMLKNALAGAAKYLGMQIPGKGKSTYTKHIEAGVQISETMPLGIKKDEVKGEWFFVPSDGQRGGARRVDRCFPRIDSGWSVEVDILILDETITREVLDIHLKEAGRFIGLGRFRPRQNGYYGRFTAEILTWE